MGLCLKVEIIGGCTIDEAAVELTNLRLAIPEISLVEADFNGFIMISGPRTTPRQLMDEFYVYLGKKKLAQPILFSVEMKDAPMVLSYTTGPNEIISTAVKTKTDFNKAVAAMRKRFNKLEKEKK